MSEPLWTFSTLVDATNARTYGPDLGRVSGVSIDSRTLEAGDSFFAVKGENFDGHDFVSAALSKGASLAVVAQERLVGLGRLTGSLAVVDDVQMALGQLASAARSRFRGKIVAVTGSVGKTTTKDMLRQALIKTGAVHSAAASYNNHIGVPLTLARMPADSPFAVFEIGMNHPGEIAPLAALVQPHVAVITTVEAVHLEAFESVDEIPLAKAEIFSGVTEGGATILNRDNRYFEVLYRLAMQAGIERIISFGRHPDADARLDEVVAGPMGSTIRADIGGRSTSYTLGAPGDHMVTNSLAVLAATQLVGGDLDAAIAALADFSPSKGRGEQFQLAIGGGAATLIDESYNANPASMRAALGLVAGSPPAKNGRRIAILGDMLELGDRELALHAELAEPIADAGVDRVYLVGERMAALWEALPQARRAVYAISAADLLSPLTNDLAAGDVVVVKASNGVRLGALVEALKQQFGAGAG